MKGAGLYLTVCESLQPTPQAVGAANATIPTQLRATPTNKVANEDAALAAHVVRQLLDHPNDPLPAALGVDETKFAQARRAVLKQRKGPRLFSAPNEILKDIDHPDGYTVAQFPQPPT